MVKNRLPDEWIRKLGTYTQWNITQPLKRNTTVQKHQFSFLYSPNLTSYMTTGKTIALARWTFVGKVISVLFNMLSRLVIIFLSRSKRLLISCLQLPCALILEPPKIVCHCFHCFPICLP